MRKIFFVSTLLLSAFVVDAQKDKVPAVQPKWNVSFHFDQISLPFFAKYRPKQSLRKTASFTRSWRISAGRTLVQANDNNNGWFRTFSIGYINNLRLQKGIFATVQQGYHFQGMKAESMITQPAFEAGALLLFQNSSKMVHQRFSAWRNLRLQAIGGLSLGAGFATTANNRYNAAALSYKLWLQGPFIKGYAPALPHQSFGLTLYR